MSGHNSTAKRVRLRKEQFPEEYCPEPRCLWHTGGGYCRRHARKQKSESESFDVGHQNDVRFGGTLDETGE